MKLVGNSLGVIAAMAISVMATEAVAETLLLNCRITDAEGANPSQWFARPPTDQDTMVRTLFMAGVAGFATMPSETWEVSLPSGDIRDPLSSTPRWRNAEIKPGSILGVMSSQSGSIFSFSFNRINNRLKLESALDAQSRREWEGAHGKPFPNIVRYELQCTVRSVG